MFSEIRLKEVLYKELDLPDALVLYNNTLNKYYKVSFQR